MINVINYHEVKVAHLVLARGADPDGVVPVVLHGAPGEEEQEGKGSNQGGP